MRISTLTRLAGVVGAIAVALAAAAAADAGGTSSRPRLEQRCDRNVDGHEPRQRLGARRRPDDALVGGRQRHRTCPRSTRGQALESSRRQRRRRTDRDRVQQHAGFSLPTGGLAGSCSTARPVSSPVERRHDAQMFRDLSKSGAVFKGLAIATTSAGPRLFATDFRHSTIDVFDGPGNLLDQPFFAFPTSSSRGTTRRSGSRRSVRGST